MRILFIVYHGFSEHSGISKKIHYQVKGLRENGHDVRLCYYGFAENDHRCRYIDGKVLNDYGKGKLAALRQRLDYDGIYDYCLHEGIEFVYARCFQNALPDQCDSHQANLLLYRSLFASLPHSFRQRQHTYRRITIAFF